MYIKNMYIYIYTVCYVLEPCSYNQLKIFPTFLASFFFCPISLSRELSGLLWAFATRTWQRRPRCGHGGFPGWHQPAGNGATHWVQGWVFRQPGVQDPTGNKAEWYLYIYITIGFFAGWTWADLAPKLLLVISCAFYTFWALLDSTKY